MEDVIRMSSLLKQDVLITEHSLACCHQDKEEEIGRAGGRQRGVRRPERVKLSQIR